MSFVAGSIAAYPRSRLPPLERKTSAKITRVAGPNLRPPVPRRRPVERFEPNILTLIEVLDLGKHMPPHARHTQMASNMPSIVQMAHDGSL